MNSGASEISLIRRAMRVQSSSLIRPARMSARRIRASADSSRMMISDLLISSEKTALVRPCLIEHERAKSRPSVDLPRPGRAATTIIWPGCRPLVAASRSAKPVGTPSATPPREAMASISSIVGCRSSSSGDVVLAGAALGDLVDGGLGAVDDVVDLGALVAVVAQLHDPGAGLDQPAQDRLLGDDLGVVGGVGRGGHRGDQRVQVRRAAEPDELAAALQLGRHGDRVGGLAAAVEVEDAVVDGLVGGPVEVVGPQHLDDVGDGVLAQQHAAEHRLLGGEVLRRLPVERGRLGALARTDGARTPRLRPAKIRLCHTPRHPHSQCIEHKFDPRVRRVPGSARRDGRP